MSKKLLRVLLVDDEPFIRQGLKALINWEDYGYTICGEAGNGIEAIEFIENHNVDLVFADIKMPGMTGLELISTLSQKKQRIRFVILTGYSDFEYIRTAMKMKVVDYILKPVQENELVEALMRINQEFNTAEAEAEDKLQKTIWQLLSGKYTDELLDNIRNYLMDGSHCSYVSFEVAVDPDETEIDREEMLKKQTLLTDNLKNMVGEYSYHVVTNQQDEGIYGAGLILSDSLLDNIGKSESEFLEYITHRLSQNLEFDFMVFQGKIVKSIADLSKSLRSVNVARSMYNLAGSSEIILKYEEKQQDEVAIIVNQNDIDKLISAVKHNDESQIRVLVKSIFDQLLKGAGSLDGIRAGFYHILYCLMEMAKEFDNENDQREVLQYISKENFGQIILHGDSEQLCQFIIDYAGYIQEVRKQEKRGILENVVEYVEIHYAENISLKTLGETFYVNSVYLGQLFKKKYGVLFKDYVTALRIEKAKEHLLNSDMRVYAIAEAVGFGKADTFISKFVALNGITPNQYRMKNKRKEE